MKTIVGNSINDLHKLTADGETTIVIPGPLTSQFGQLTFEQANKIIAGREDEYRIAAMKMVSEIERQINNTEISYNVGWSLFFDVNIKIGGYSYSQGIRAKLQQLKFDVEMYEEGDEVPSITIVKKHDPKSERATISRIANEIGIKVKTESHPGEWVVTYKDPDCQHPKATSVNLMQDIQFWLSTLTPMTPTEPPKEIVTGCTDSYFRTVLNKSPYFASYRRGRVTVYPAGITGGQVYLGATPLAPVGVTCTTEYLDMVLGPYGYRHDAVMGWERHCVQGGAA